MTYREELALYKSEAKRACKENGIKVLIKNMTLLESGLTKGIVDYVMFEDRATGKQYQCGFSWSNYTADHPTPWRVTEYEVRG